jgi:HEAT repeat protein
VPTRTEADDCPEGVSKGETSNPALRPNEPPGPEEIRGKLLGSDPVERRNAIVDLTRNCDHVAHESLLIELLTGEDARLADDILTVVAVERPQVALSPLLNLVAARLQLAPKLRQVIFAAYEPEQIASATIAILRRSERHVAADWVQYLPILTQCRSARAVEFLVEALPKAEQGLKIDILRVLEQLTGQSVAEADWPKWWAANREKSRELWLEDALAEARRASASMAAEWLSVRLQAMKSAGATSEQTDDFLKQILLGKDRELRRTALAAMLETEREASVRLNQVISELSSEEYSEDTRVLALRLLAAISDVQVLDRIISCLTDRKPAIRKTAALALGKFDCSEAVAALLGSLAQEDHDFLAAVIESLGKLKARQAVPRICEFLATSDSAEILQAAVTALGAIGEPGSASAIIAAKEKFMLDHRLRSSFAAALGNFSTPGIEDVLEPLLTDEYSSVRLAAVISLGSLRAVRLLPQLMEVLRKDKEPSVRRAAAATIGQTGELSAIPALLRALQDDEPVATEAWQAVLNLAGDDPELLLSIAENMAGTSVTEHRVTRLAVELLRDLLKRARFPTVQPELANRCRAFLARILVDMGEDLESAEVLEQLHASGERTEWSETALMGAYSRTHQFAKAVGLCDHMLAGETHGSERFWQLRLERVSLLFEAEEFKSSRESAAAILAETDTPENIRAKADAFTARCDQEIERIAAAEQVVKQRVSFALAEMLTPDAQRRDAAALQILEQGRKAVPVLLEILETGQVEYYATISNLLEHITGLEYPLVPTSSQAEVQQAVHAWRNWWNESK